MRTGRKGAVDETVGHTATLTCHLGTLAAITGRTLRWNAQKEDVENDAKASALLTRSLRKPYHVIGISTEGGQAIGFQDLAHRCP